MKCICSDSREGIVLCDAHAREYKRRMKLIAGDLAMAGEDLRKELRFRAPGIEPLITEIEQKWLAALRKAKEACDA
jgi:hypothetical protein